MRNYLLILLAVWLIHDPVGLSDIQKQSINAILDNADSKNAELMVNISFKYERGITLDQEDYYKLVQQTFRSYLNDIINRYIK